MGLILDKVETCKMLELLNACDANAEQKGFLVVLGCLVDEKNIEEKALNARRGGPFVLARNGF